MATEYQCKDEATVLTFRCRPEPSTCQGLRLMSLIFRTQSARVALMSRERVRCPRGLCGIHPDVSVYRGTRESAGTALGSSPCEPQRITERVTVRTFARHCSTTDRERADVPDIRTYLRTTKKEEALVRRRKFTPLLSALLQDETRLISRC